MDLENKHENHWSLKSINGTKDPPSGVPLDPPLLRKILPCCGLSSQGVNVMNWLRPFFTNTQPVTQPVKNRRDWPKWGMLPQYLAIFSWVNDAADRHCSNGHLRAPINGGLATCPFHQRPGGWDGGTPKSSISGIFPYKATLQYWTYGDLGIIFGDRTCSRLQPPPSRFFQRSGPPCSRSYLRTQPLGKSHVQKEKQWGGP